MYAEAHRPDESDPWITAMNQDTRSTKHAINRNIVIGIIPQNSVAFLIFLTVLVQSHEKNLFWIGLGTLAICSFRVLFSEKKVNDAHRTDF